MKIEDYSFVDFSIGRVSSANEVGVAIETKRSPWVALYKNDVIALAKHFKLTADDLKDE